MQRLLLLSLFWVIAPSMATAGAVKLELTSTQLQLSLGEVVVQDDQTASQTSEEPPTRLEEAELRAEPRANRPYASQGSVSWWTEIGVGTNFNHGWEANGGIGIEWYPVDGVALGVRADGIGVGLRGTPATAGAGASLLVRWHFLLRERWSMYFEGGCGIAYFSSRVPSGAAHLNFTPQAGVGCTVRIDDQLRLMAGVRWFHISNGQTASSNPGVDMMSGYLGLTMPF
ncbi:MAG: acyloxyacyl hydrolase [Phycisphaerales bacterium]|nr:acyloxyacyl hydrolase [Phycisphaerales bacterium]